MSLIQSTPRLGGPGLVGARGEQTWLTVAEAELVQSFDPTGDTIGFFIAKFHKS